MMIAAVRLATWVVTFSAVFCTYRLARRRSALLGGIFAVGVITRAILGFGLFAISILNLPVLKGLHSGNGFWPAAIDAQWYFEHAATAARVGLGTIPDTAPSPAYLRALAIWLGLAGVSPANAVIFNLLCYVGVTFVIIAACRSLVGATLALFAFTADPALVIIGTQSLKDPFCILFTVVVLGGMRLWGDGLHADGSHRALRTSGGLLLTALAVFTLTGVRAYLGAFVVIAVATAAVAAVIAARRRYHTAAAYGALIVVIYGAFVQGAGASFPYYKAFVLRVLHDQGALLQDLDKARAGFDAVGGNTSFGSDVPSDAAPFELRVNSGTSIELQTRARRLLLGCAVMFVPVSILHALSVVTFKGGRGMLFFTDIDTVFIDLTLAGCALVLVGTRPKGLSIPLLMCGVVFAILITVGLSYIVTNFGTLVRLRLMAIAPLWVLPALVVRESAEKPKPVL